MTLWLVRAGKNGEQEHEATEQGLVSIAWSDLPDLGPVNERERLTELMESTYPDASAGRIANHGGQVYAFAHRIQVGDHVVLPLKTRPLVAIGRITGGYEYRSHGSAPHVRRVEWIRTDLPRSRIDQDLLYSLGAFMTVCEIKRNNAKERLLALANGAEAPLVTLVEAEQDAEAPVDLESLALDQVRQLIERRFKGHAMEGLVAAVLRAEGYTVHEHGAGPDGGIDLLAGSGAFGLESPKVAVQVKSSHSSLGSRDLREFHHIVARVGADHGLCVSWGGYKDTALKEQLLDFFRIRLWTSDDLIRAIFRVYERLPESIRVELPLKRAWIVVEEDGA